MHNTIKYYNDIPRYEGCDCPMPVRQLTSNPRLGTATNVRLCCMAVKLSGGVPEYNGTPITDYIDFYEFTHVKATVDARGNETASEYVVAAHPWDEDEDCELACAIAEVNHTEMDGTVEVIVVDAPEVPAIWGKKGPAPEYIKVRALKKGQYKEAPSE